MNTDNNPRNNPRDNSNPRDTNNPRDTYTQKFRDLLEGLANIDTKADAAKAAEQLAHIMIGAIKELEKVTRQRDELLKAQAMFVEFLEAAERSDGESRSKIDSLTAANKHLRIRRDALDERIDELASINHELRRDLDGTHRTVQKLRDRLSITENEAANRLAEKELETIELHQRLAGAIDTSVDHELNPSTPEASPLPSVAAELAAGMAAATDTTNEVPDDDTAAEPGARLERKLGRKRDIYGKNLS